ncbi:hypothetical protein OBBRIDRAFT_229434 [Obba rivulosa]|uniref:Uncharacterized protein n=1 Tax=Obba rivulosa TaxID=1052685 RepID=A0A8E2J871_9APHY|nr:hypothetical protein OBBRIDRAFT_229434 [Obba rivulosa]
MPPALRSDVSDTLEESLYRAIMNGAAPRRTRLGRRQLRGPTFSGPPPRREPHGGPSPCGSERLLRERAGSASSLSCRSIFAPFLLQISWSLELTCVLSDKRVQYTTTRGPRYPFLIFKVQSAKHAARPGLLGPHRLALLRHPLSAHPPLLLPGRIREGGRGVAAARQSEQAAAAGRSGPRA